MHGTRTPLRLWLWAIYLVSSHTPGISAKQLQRQLGLSRYETVWLILQKLRRALVAPEAPLCGRGRGRRGLRGGRQPRRRAGRDPVGKRLVGLQCRSVEPARAGCVSPCSRTRPSAAWAVGGCEVVARTIVHTDDWRGYADSVISASNIGRSPSAGVARSACWSCPELTVPSPTSRPSCRELTAAPPRSTCRPTSTSSSSATTAGAPRWPPSRRCAGSARCIRRAPTPRSPQTSQPERTGILIFAAFSGRQPASRPVGFEA